VVHASHRCEPDRGDWRNQRRDPADGRGLKRPADHMSRMTRLMCHRCRDSRHWLARKDSNLRSPDQSPA
jgi:hypothetical protein